ncbi:MAG: homoserine dehydrogenase [Clostridia bacterium]|nr:homoserine dehydrogenase [Clostridia bacterium]
MKLAILGFGTVGGGTADMLVKNAELLAARAGEPIEIKYIVDIREFPDSPFADKIIKDFSVVESDKEISLVIEVIGGAKIAYDFTRRALLAGKSVVTSNKELVATHGAELLAIAKEKGCFYLFEAAVGGGIPVLSPLTNELGHNEISEISGILNGTTNYILTRMFSSGASFEAALAEAQAKGYAESDPTADVEGHDAARKIAILGALASGKLFSADHILTEGIRGIRAEDVAAAAKIGYSIKLLGRYLATRSGDLFLLVAPFMIPAESPLSGISDVYNGVLVRGNFVDDVMFYGRGAGAAPTASAVVADVDKIARGVAQRPLFANAESDALTDISFFSARRYVVVEGVDANAAQIIFGETEPLSSEENAFLTVEMSEDSYLTRVKRLEACGGSVVSHIRLYR